MGMKQTAEAVVLSVMNELNGRRGYRQLWDGLDEDTQTELVETLREKVLRQLMASATGVEGVIGRVLMQAAVEPPEETLDVKLKQTALAVEKLSVECSALSATPESRAVGFLIRANGVMWLASSQLHARSVDAQERVAKKLGQLATLLEALYAPAQDDDSDD